MNRKAPRLPGLFALPESMQSVLHPETATAQHIMEIGWVMIGGGVAIFLGVIVLALYALFARANRRAKIGGHGMIVAAGIVFPIVTLLALLLYALIVADAIVDIDEPTELRIEVVGEQFWWRVRYLDGTGQLDAETANEIHIPVGRAVKIQVKSADVIHSFWIPNVSGKIDMIPGRTNALHLKVEQPGMWRGQCAEYCGAQHAKMSFHLVAENPEAFAVWLANQRSPATEPKSPILQRGKSLFLSKTCGLKECCVDCHTVRGTGAHGDHGPDLTHVGSRRWIAAGTLPNNAGTLGGWITSSQHIKPGNHMPSFRRYAGEDLRALAAYLESLK